MICPDCQKGVVLVLRGQKTGEMRPYRGTTFLANPEKYFDKAPCPRCNGSGIAYCCDGEDASQPDPIIGDQASAIEDKPMVA
jgi:hypothetical protein